jgi:FkbM family methyltransferase
MISQWLQRFRQRPTAACEEATHGVAPSAQALRTRLFRQLRDQGFKPNHIIDVGAHRGDWSRDARHYFPEAGFTLIEPQIEMAPCLETFCQETRQARWLVAGAGALPGELHLTVTDRLDTSSFAFTANHAENNGFERRLVPVVTLDAVCTDSPIPEMVKIDAEGFDLQVMQGSQKLLGATELFFLEVLLFDYFPGQSLQHTVSFMASRGYEPFDITDLNRRPSDGALALMEVAFARRNGFLRANRGW